MTMVARVTQAEIDAVRMSVGDAVALYERSVLPALHEQDGYQGAYLLLSPEGKALVMTFWETEAQAQEGIGSGFYDEQVAKFVTIYKSPPGRGVYAVVLADTPVVTAD